MQSIKEALEPISLMKGPSDTGGKINISVEEIEAHQVDYILVK